MAAMVLVLLPLPLGPRTWSWPARLKHSAACSSHDGSRRSVNKGSPCLKVDQSCAGNTRTPQSVLEAAGQASGTLGRNLCKADRFFSASLAKRSRLLPNHVSPGV